MTARRSQQKLAKFRALGSADKWMLLHATVWLALARLMLIVVPFRKLAARLSGEHDSANDAPGPELLARVALAVQTAAGNVPWRSDCFPQSIAGWMLLRHHGYRSTIHLGVNRSGGDELLGHAWLTCGDETVTGADDLDRFTEMHRFSR
jgi:hypothetical protein